MGISKSKQGTSSNTIHDTSDKQSNEDSKVDLPITGVYTQGLLWLKYAKRLNVPSEVWYHTVCLVGDAMFLFGGRNDSGELSNAMYYKSVLDLNDVWHLCDVKGTPPAPCFCHAACAVGRTIYIFGGLMSSRYCNEFYSFDTATFEWTKLPRSSPFPEPRWGHCMTRVRTNLYIYGGISNYGSYQNDLWEYNTVTGEWKELVFKGDVPQRYNFAMTTGSDGQIYMFGGWQGTSESLMNNLMVLNLETLEWRQCEQYGHIPPPRAGHAMCCAHKLNKLIVHGGLVQTTKATSVRMSDVYMYDIHTKRWTFCEIRGPYPTPCSGHTLTVVDTTALDLNDFERGEARIKVVDHDDLSNRTSSFVTTNKAEDTYNNNRNSNSNPLAYAFDGQVIQVFLIGGCDRNERKLSQVNIIMCCSYQSDIANLFGAQ